VATLNITGIKINIFIVKSNSSPYLKECIIGAIRKLPDSPGTDKIINLISTQIIILP